MRDIAIPTERATAGGAHLSTKAGKVLLPVGVFALFLVAWQIFIHVAHVQPFIMPTPTSIWSSFTAQPAMFLSLGWHTTEEAAEGLAIALVLGTFISLLTFRNGTAVALARSYSAALMALPVVAVIPLANVYLGFTPTARVFVVAMATTPILVLYVIGGLARTDPGLIDSFRSCAASPMKTLWGAYLPSSLPALMSGLRVAVPAAFAVAVIAEFFGGSLNTLGTFIKSAALQSQVPQLWGASMMAFFYAIALFAVVLLADFLLVTRQRGLV
jgi:ABC-type nitrate/sulfonate/bicarbonate transport system permease component